jgi:hypothetical protein
VNAFTGSPWGCFGQFRQEALPVSLVRGWCTAAVANQRRKTSAARTIAAAYAPADVLGQREEHVRQHHQGPGHDGGEQRAAVEAERGGGRRAVEAPGARGPHREVCGEDRQDADGPGQQERAPRRAAYTPAAQAAGGAPPGDERGDERCQRRTVSGGLAQGRRFLDPPDVDALGGRDGGGGERKERLQDDEAGCLASGDASRRGRRCAG